MNFLYNIYFALPNFARKGLAGKAINRILGMILKRIFDAFVPAYLKRTADKAGYGLNTDPRDEIFIVSLTSFPARINDIWITIETILRQSFKPDKIILWLGKDEFASIKLPESLKNLTKRGLSIKFVEDLRSHTKYYYAFQQFPNSIVITLDDDLYYPDTILSNLIFLHEKFPDAICSNRVHKITISRNGIEPYRKWNHNYKKELVPKKDLLLTGVSGVLYPCKPFNHIIFDKSVFKNHCFTADDIWLTINSYLSNRKIVTGSRFNKDLITVSNTQRFRLLKNNSYEGGNDRQLRNLMNHYNIAVNSLTDNSSFFKKLVKNKILK